MSYGDANQIIPTLDQLASDPSCASILGLSVLAALQARCAAAQGAIAAAMSGAIAQTARGRIEQGMTDRTLNADQIALELGTTRRQVFRNSKKYPFIRRTSRKVLVCSEAALLRWREAQKG
jgi:hypothetical protein